MENGSVKFELNIKTFPPCNKFLQLRNPESDYLDVSDFFNRYKYNSRIEMNNCFAKYRGEVISFREYNEDTKKKFNSMKFIAPYYSNDMDKISNETRFSFFYNRSAEYLQHARYFILLQYPIYDPTFFLGYEKGYLGYYSVRCCYFETSLNWFASCFDTVVQSLYWRYGLYKYASNKKGTYNNSWTMEQTLRCCDYDFVKKQLKIQNYVEEKELLTDLYGKLNRLFKWNNSVKHRGGLDFQYLKPQCPSLSYLFPEDCLPSVPEMMSNLKLYDKYKVEEYRGLKVDIDRDVKYLIKFHNLIFDFLTKIIKI